MECYYLKTTDGGRRSVRAKYFELNVNGAGQQQLILRNYTRRDKCGYSVPTRSAEQMRRTNEPFDCARLYLQCGGRVRHSSRNQCALLCACVAFDVSLPGRLCEQRVRYGALTFRNVARVIGPTLARLITISKWGSPGVQAGARDQVAFTPRFLMPVHCAGIPFILPFFEPSAPLPRPHRHLLKYEITQ